MAGVEYGAAPRALLSMGHQLDGQIRELAEFESALGIGLHPGVSDRPRQVSGDVAVGVRDLGGDRDAGDGGAFRVDDAAG